MNGKGNYLRKRCAICDQETFFSLFEKADCIRICSECTEAIDTGCHPSEVKDEECAAEDWNDLIEYLVEHQTI